MATTAAIISGLVSAYGSYSSAEKQKEAAEAGNSSSSTRTPWAPTEGALKQMLADSYRSYQQGPVQLGGLGEGTHRMQMPRGELTDLPGFDPSVGNEGNPGYTGPRIGGYDGRYDPANPNFQGDPALATPSNAAMGMGDGPAGQRPTGTGLNDELWQNMGDVFGGLNRNGNAFEGQLGGGGESIWDWWKSRKEN